MTAPLVWGGPRVTRRGLLLATAATTAGVVPAFARPSSPPGGGRPEVLIRALGAVATGTPVSFGFAYAKGDVPAGSSVTVELPGGAVPAQLDQVNRWSDGSLRFAAHSVRLPAGLSAGQVATARLTPAASPAQAGGAATAAQIAEASDWKLKVVLLGSGPDAGPYTVSVNGILADFHGWNGTSGPRQPGWGQDPLGGWDLYRSGPVCTGYRAWRYLKRDADGASHPFVKVVFYLDAYPDGRGGFSYRVLPVVKQANTYGPHPAAHVPVADASGQRARGALYELWNGATLVHRWGGPADPDGITVPAAGIDADTGEIRFSGFDASRLKGAGFTVQGATLPHPLPAAPLYLSSQGHLYFGRKDCFENRGAGDASWRASEALGQYQARKANGCIWVNLTPGTTAAGAAPRPTNPQGGITTTADGIRWFQASAAFSPRQPGSFRLVPIPFTTAGSALPLVPPSSAPIWFGPAPTAPDRLVIGPDPAYLMTRTKAVTPLDPGGRVPNYDPQIGPPFRTNVPYYLWGRIAWNSTGNGPDDEAIGWLGVSPANLAMNPLDPVCERVVRNLAWSFSDFQINWDDHRTGRPAHGGTKPWPGFIPNPGLNFYPSQAGHGSPPWPGIAEDDNFYGGSYGPVVDSSHMPSPFIMPYLRSAHPFFIDQAISQSFALNNSLGSGNRNPTDSHGVRRDYNFLYYWNGEVGVRVFAWALRHHGTLDFLMPDDDPARPVIRDMMDGVGTYAGILESEHLKNAFPGDRKTDFGATKLGLLYVADGVSVTDPVNHNPGPQQIHCFMYAHFGTASFMEQWRGERPGFKAMGDVLARYIVGAFDFPNGTYELDRYSIGCQDAAGKPAYPDWRTLWARNHYGITAPNQMPPDAGFRYGVSDTGTMMLGAIAMRATCGDAAALRVWNAGMAPARAQGGIPFIMSSGAGNYSGHPIASATYAIAPVRT